MVLRFTYFDVPCNHGKVLLHDRNSGKKSELCGADLPPTYTMRASAQLLIKVSLKEGMDVAGVDIKYKTEAFGKCNFFFFTWNLRNVKIMLPLPSPSPSPSPSSSPSPSPSLSPCLLSSSLSYFYWKLLVWQGVENAFKLTKNTASIPQIITTI